MALHLNELKISFEYYPPKTLIGREKLRQVRAILNPYKPEYCSVTYGAGGTTRRGSIDILQEMMQEGIEATAHISGIGMSKEEMQELLQQLYDMRIRRLVVLRGDIPSGYGGLSVSAQDFQYASRLVEFIRLGWGRAFVLAVAGYPEIHPQAQSWDQDIQFLVEKVEAGADWVITQLFYNVDGFLYWRDEVQKKGIHIPIVPGIMPIYNSSDLLRFAQTCGAEIPRWLDKKLKSLGSDVPAIRAFGIEVVTNLCTRLVAEGVPGLHFYTLNLSSSVQAVLDHIMPKN
ncbi:MAG: methylenetetrahydrofolate reductase [NAD(P)H] [Gammaproteobacteria bacterium]|nr:methylenetetrahydrofolate reductase [NAD(P)H] [Gammaproteobacteria bacterium]